MTKLKKLTAVLLSVIMFVCCFSVQTSAASIYDKAVKLSPMELASSKFEKSADNYYKITVSDSGKITFYYSEASDYWNFQYCYFTLLDSNGNEVIERKALQQVTNKKYVINKKGTYYAKIEKSNENSYFTNFYYGFQPDHTPTISLALNVKVGDELDFSALASNYTGKCTWKTTKSAVASVDGGTVTCKKAGKAKIRAYMNNGNYAEITLIVKKK